MARDKMFDPAFLKSFTEVINKENKIRALKYAEDVSGFPRSARVDFGASYESDESDIEEESGEAQKRSEGECVSCGKEILDDILNAGASSELPDSRPETGVSSTKTRKQREESLEAEYIFPICTFCDFGWNYTSRKYIVCPKHGHFRRGRFGYSQPLKNYLLDQIRREAQEKEKQAEKSKLSNNVYL